MTNHNRTALDRICWVLSRHRLTVLIIILVITGSSYTVLFEFEVKSFLQNCFPMTIPILSFMLVFLRFLVAEVQG